MHTYIAVLQNMVKTYNVCIQSYCLRGCDHGLDCPFDIRLPVCVTYFCSESESDASSLLYGVFKEKGAVL